MSDRKLVMVGCINRSVCDREIRNTEEMLDSYGFWNRSDKLRGVVKIPSVEICFVSIHDLRSILGCRCNGCYGFNTKETEYLTRGKNECEGIELLDYITKIEMEMNNNGKI